MLIAVILVIAGGTWYTLGKTDVKPYEYAVASKGNVVQEVSVTGRVVPAEEVSLAFEQGGRIQGVSVSVGDKVERGDVLLSLSADDTRAQLAQAQATVAAEEAKLAELKNGTRAEEISIYEAKVASAKSSLYDAEKGAVEAVQDAYTKSDDVIHNKADQLFNDPRTRNAELDVFVNNDQLRIDVERQRIIIEGILEEWRTSSDRLLPSSDLENAVDDAKAKLTTIRAFLDDMAYITTMLTASTDLSATTITGWKTDITTGRTNVNTAVSLVSAAEEKWRAALSALDVAKADLAYKRSGSPEEQIAAQKARVDQMKANVSMYLATLSKATLRAPISGVVTKQDGKRGEIVSMNAPLVSIMSSAQYEIEAYVAEADLAKIKIGDAANITLDAYGDSDIFAAMITEIDPAETIKEGVSTYKTTLQFTANDERIKSGMTANVVVAAGMKEGVVSVPGRAVLLENGVQYVRIVRDEKTNMIEKTPVTVGLRGSDGSIEIISGVNEGDKVVTFMKDAAE